MNTTKYTFADAAEDAFKISNKPLTGRSLWDEIVKLGLDKKIDFKTKTPWDSLSGRVIDHSTGNNKRFIVDRTHKPILFSLNTFNNISKPSVVTVTSVPTNNFYKRYTFTDAAEEAFKILNKPLNARALWDEIVKLGLDRKLGTQGNTPYDSLRSQMSIDSKRVNSRFIEDRSQNPIVYSLKSFNNNLSIIPLVSVNIQSNKKYPYFERELHPFLVGFAFEQLNNTYCKTIFHEKSTKKSFNEWIHPDIVGFSFPFNYSEEVLRFTNNGFDLIKFYSFEMKRELDLSNLRESFFQAVSNSSWAHEGYLVAANIKKSEKSLLLELERLSNSFGIGVIELNLDEPEKTKILFPSKTKSQIDWDAVDKLVQENSDFKNFMKDVRIDVSNNKLHKQNYDEPKKIDQLKKLYQSFK